LVPAFLVGLAFAVTISAGSSLLLYTGRGLLRGAGLLIAVAVGALAAGAWVGAGTPGNDRRRWVATLLVYGAAALAVFTLHGVPAIGGWGPASSVGLLMLLALPAYATGLLVGGQAAAGSGGEAVAALAGAAAGVLLATSELIPHFEPPTVFIGAAATVLAALLADWPRAGSAGGSMAGRVAIVTGVGSRGQLGYAIARRLAEAGWRVVASGRSAGVVDLAAELAADGSEVAGVAADLLDEGQAQQLVAATVGRFGRLDALINAAGGLTLVRSVEDTHLDELQRELDRNLATAQVTSRAALLALRESHGAIVNFASPAAFRPGARLAAYSAAKAGVVALTQALAQEEKAAGVRVNAIAPGTVDTEQNRAESGEAGAFVSREAVADVVLFLISPAARAITGETIRVLRPVAD